MIGKPSTGTIPGTILFFSFFLYDWKWFFRYRVIRTRLQQCFSQCLFFKTPLTEWLEIPPSFYQAHAVDIACTGKMDLPNPAEMINTLWSICSSYVRVCQYPVCKVYLDFAKQGDSKPQWGFSWRVTQRITSDAQSEVLYRTFLFNCETHSSCTCQYHIWVSVDASRPLSPIQVRSPQFLRHVPVPEPP